VRRAVLVQPYEPALFTVSLQSGDTEAEQAFDTAKGLEGGPTTKALDGRQAKFDVGFGGGDRRTSSCR
jgi:hypothetical protein